MNDIKNDISVCILSLFRYEEKYLDEWVNYHLNLGFDRIFILDNNDYKDRLIYNNDKVVVIPFNDIDFSNQKEGEQWSTNIQVYAYNYGLTYIKKLNYDYVAVIDNDEFFEFKTTGNVKDFIKNEMIDMNIECCNITWQLHNDNEIIYEKDRKPSIIESFPFSFKKSVKFKNSKCMFKLKEDTKFDNTPHFISNVDLHLKELNTVVLHHYRFKTLEEYIKVKCLKNNCCKGETYRNNLVKFYFTNNIITLEKLKAFKDILNENDIYDTDEYINELINNIDIIYFNQTTKKWYNRYMRNKQRK